MLNDNERGLNRATRRALLSKRRGTIQKKTPFGRVKVLDFMEDIIEGGRSWVVYKHITRGLVVRRETSALLNNLISVG